MAILLLLLGCRSQGKESTKIQQKDLAPKSLIEVSKDIDAIFKNTEQVEKILDGTYIQTTEEKKIPTQETKKESQNQSSQNQDSKQQSEAKTSQESEQNQIQSKDKEKDELLLKIWKSTDEKIEKVHTMWNTFEVEGLKKGTTKEKIDNFEKSLNFLTKSIENRNINEIYDYGSQTMFNLGPIYDIYIDDIRGDISRIKYSAYKAYLMSTQGKIKDALKLLSDTDEYISRINIKIEKNNEKTKSIDKVKLSIGDMIKSLDQDSIKLFRRNG